MAAAIANPSFPYAKRHIGIPIFPVFGKINGGRSRYISLFIILSTIIPKTENKNTYNDI
jgi:hypothetical protein